MEYLPVATHENTLQSHRTASAQQHSMEKKFHLECVSVHEVEFCNWQSVVKQCLHRSSRQPCCAATATAAEETVAENGKICCDLRCTQER